MFRLLERPGPVGVGSSQHLAGAYFEQVTGTELVHVPYRNIAQYVPDLIAGSVPAGFQFLPNVIAPLQSRDAYSEFVLRSLLAHVDTAHVLLVQWDGYVVNPAAWRAEFLDYDYIGATWFWHDDSMRVGNGGFSLRSRKLLSALQDPRIVLTEAEDVTICRAFRPLLERDHDIRFASEALTDSAIPTALVSHSHDG